MNFKTHTLLFFFFFSLSALFAQEQEKAMEGVLFVNLEEKASGIKITNLRTGQEVFSDEYGKFEMQVRANDKLFFSGEGYNSFELTITSTILNNQTLKIDLTQGITMLDQVTLRPDLIGDLQLDIKKLPFYKADFPKIKGEEIINTIDFEFRPDQFTVPAHEMFDKTINSPYVDIGSLLGFVLQAIFSKKGKNVEEDKSIDAVAYLRRKFPTEFFVDNLEIEEDKIYEFLYFVEERELKNISSAKLEALNLMDLLLAQAKEFKQIAGS